MSSNKAEMIYRVQYGRCPVRWAVRRWQAVASCALVRHKERMGRQANGHWRVKILRVSNLDKNSIILFYSRSQSKNTKTTTKPKKWGPHTYNIELQKQRWVLLLLAAFYLSVEFCFIPFSPSVLPRLPALLSAPWLSIGWKDLIINFLFREL